MKRIFCLSLLLLMAQPVWASVATPCGQEEGDTNSNCWTCGDDCTARLDSTGQMTISGTGDMYDYSVVAWNGVAQGKKPWDGANITSVVIDEGIERIGNSAFCNVSNLASISIPNTVTSIGATAFSGTALTSLEIPSSVKSLDVGVFHKLDHLETLILSEGIENIPSIAFATSPHLTNIVIPSTVTNIHEHAFDGSSINKMYCTGAQIESGLCSAQANHYELDDGMYVLYNSDGTINSIYESNGALLQGVTVVDEYTKKDENGNPLAVYDGRGNLQMSYGYNQDGSVSVYDANGKLIGLQGKRILTVDEASVLVKNNKNTFKLKYR